MDARLFLENSTACQKSMPIVVVVGAVLTVVVGGVLVAVTWLRRMFNVSCTFDRCQMRTGPSGPLRTSVALRVSVGCL